MRIITCIFSLLLLVSITACKKDKEGAKAIEISFVEPQLNDTIPSWNQIHAEGTITADGEVNGYAIYFNRVSDGVELFSTTYDVKSEAYNFHEHWINNLYDTTRVQVKVVAFTKNEEFNKTEIREVICLP